MYVCVTPQSLSMMAMIISFRLKYIDKNVNKPYIYTPSHDVRIYLTLCMQYSEHCIKGKENT